MTTSNPQPAEPIYEDIPDPVVGAIVDERTSQIIPKGASVTTPPGSTSIMPNYDVHLETVGTLKLSSDETAILTEPLNPEDVLIRPDGLVYLPWTWYNSRLNRSLGLLQWGNIPQGDPRTMPYGTYGDVLVVWPHWLVVRGIVVSMAIGETTYKPDNKTMSFTDAAEGAKSISLTRNCKVLGMALELWDQAWGENWKAQYAELIDNPNSNARAKKIWHKRKDPTIAGKYKMRTQLVPTFYNDGTAILEAMKRLGLTYSLEKHDEIVIALVKDVLNKAG